MKTNRSSPICPSPNKILSAGVSKPIRLLQVNLPQLNSTLVSTLSNPLNT